MKVFPHGQGAGEGPTNYLVREDYPGRDVHLPDVLRGDPEVTRVLIDSLDTTWRFTAGALSWHPDDTVTPEQEQRVMDDFEALAFAGLEADQRNILWVRHVHAGHHELHFVIPRVELVSGKAFNPCPPGWQKHFDLFRDLHNHREGWARPDDPARTRMYTPAPDLPCDARVCVNIWRGEDVCDKADGWTYSTPIRADDGQWYIVVSAQGRRFFANCADVRLLPMSAQLGHIRRGRGR